MAFTIRGVPIALIQCEACRNEIASKAKVCPHCGSSVRDDNTFAAFENARNGRATQSTPVQPNSAADSHATTAMVFALVGFFLSIPVVNIIFAIFAITYGNQAKKMPNLTRTKEAQAGIVVGWIALIYSIIVGLF